MNVFIYFLTYLCFFLFAFGQLGRVSFFNQRVNLYLYEPIFFLISFLIIVSLRRIVLKTIKEWKSLVIFISFTIFSFLLSFIRFSLFDNVLHGLYLVRLILYFLSFICLVSYVKKNPYYSFIITSGLSIVIVFTAFTSLFQYFFYPDLRNLLYLGWDQHLFRTFGVYFDTSVAASLYGLIFLYLLNNVERQGFSKLIILGMSFVYLVLAVLSYSRALYIALFIVLTVKLLGKKNLIQFILIIGIALSLFFMVPRPYGEGVNLTRMFSVVSRYEDYRQGLSIWSRYPIFGIGYNRIRAYKSLNSIDLGTEDVSHSGASFHSSFVIILVTSGVVGLITFLWFMKDLFLRFSSSKEFILLVVLLSLFDNILLHPFVMFLFIQLLVMNSKKVTLLFGKSPKD